MEYIILDIRVFGLKLTKPSAFNGIERFYFQIEPSRTGNIRKLTGNEDSTQNGSITTCH